MLRFSLFFVLIGLVLFASISLAAIPKLINYQGMLTDNSGSPLNGSYDITFKLYISPAGWTVRWEETQSAVSVTNGLFNVILGSVNPLNLDFSESYWLDVTVGTEHMPTRLQFTSVGYAYRSQWSDSASYARASGGGSGSLWIFRVTDTADTTITTGGVWGLARFGNVLYGNADYTHVNLGVACTTGANGQNNIYCTVGGGLGNTASGYATTVGGGSNNRASTYFATIGGGGLNIASGDVATVGGGGSNTAGGVYATVGGGSYHSANGNWATVGGGEDNTAGGEYSTVGGGLNNNANGVYTTVGGGSSNVASGAYSATVAGGAANTADGQDASVGGGWQNRASGQGSVAPGGFADTAAGDYSLAAGAQVRITSDADYTFAFGRNFRTSTPNAVIFCHPSSATRVGINKTDPSYALDLPNNPDASGRGRANQWFSYSSLRWKENINPIEHALDKVLSMRGVYFDWKESKKHDIGMIAEEVGEVFPEVVSYEGNGQDAQAMDYGRLTAVLIEAIKEQQRELKDQRSEIELLKAKIETLGANKR